jgi:hypothetical protein
MTKEGDMMTRHGSIGVVVLAIAVTAALGTPSLVRAAPTAQLCRPFKAGGLTFRSETLGTGWTCSSARSWISRLSQDRVRVTTRNVALRNGPSGYHCIATPNSRGGRATSGACFKGTIAFPGSGFAWFEA